MPRTLGESFIHVDHIDLAIECDVPPYEHVVGEIGEVERRIGEFVADLVPDGATIQMGIGAIPAAVGAALADKHDLGVHTEMFTDIVVDLVEAGVINGSRKERNRGKIVAAFMMGTKRLYDFVHDNPMVEMRPVDFTNDTHVIRSFSRMTAINSAIEIDLTGQIVADSIGHRMYSGVGGQMDFVRGASLASEGRAIIALPVERSRRHEVAHRRRRSRRAPASSRPARTPGPSSPSTGVAELWGRSLRERAEALIAIADPDFRDELRRGPAPAPGLARLPAACGASGPPPRPDGSGSALGERDQQLERRVALDLRRSRRPPAAPCRGRPDRAVKSPGIKGWVSGVPPVSTARRIVRPAMGHG